MAIRVTKRLDSMYWKVSRGTVLVLIFILNTGFAGAPFARWTGGKVTHIDAVNRKLSLLEADGKTEEFFWNKDTLFWIGPARRRDRGVAFEANEVKAGSEVRVMFKKSAAGKRLTKVIRNGAGAANGKSI